MATTERWEFTNSTTLSYILEETNDTTGKVTKTTLAKITGLANMKKGDDDKFYLVDPSTGAETELEEGADKDYGISYTQAVDGSYTGTVTISARLLKTVAGAKVTLSPAKKYDLKLTIPDTSLVTIKTTGEEGEEETTEKVTYDSANGKIVVKGDLLAGYAYAANKLSATYQEFKSDQTLTTITGLNKKYTENTVAFEDAAVTGGGTGTFTFTKAEDLEGEDGATDSPFKTISKANTVDSLGTSNIKATTNTTLVNNGINYYLDLGGDDYAQEDINTGWSYDPYWTVKGTTATYQITAPKGYALHTAENATQIDYTASKTITIATVTGLLSGITVDTTDKNKEKPEDYTEGVGIITTTVGTEDKDSDGNLDEIHTYAAGLSATYTLPTYEGGKVKKDTANNNALMKGTVTVTVSSGNVLPLSGTVKVTPGSDYTATTEIASSGTGLQVKTDENYTTEKEFIWTVSGTTATYKLVELAYAEAKTNQIVVTKQKDLYTLLTIKNLNADALKAGINYKPDTYPQIIKSITGINLDGAPTPTLNASNKYGVANGTPDGTVTIAGNLLNEKNVTISSRDPFKLVIDKDLAPQFDDYKWNLSGTTATLKGEIKGGTYDSDELNGGYTVDNSGKTITYTKAAKNQTLATITGLKSGTRLVTSGSGSDITRTIGFGGGSAFSYGVSGTFQDNNDDNDALTYNSDESNADYGKLVKLPITISKNVLGTGKVAIKSTFFNLALNDDTDNSDDEVHFVLNKAGASTPIVDWHGTYGATMTLKSTKPAYYELDSLKSSISYTAPDKNAVTIATVKGLNKNITEDDISFNTTEGTITINNADALTTGNVTLTRGTYSSADVADVEATVVDAGQWKLVVGSDSSITEPVLTNEVWTQDNKGVVNYTAKVKQGYKLSADAQTLYYTASTAANKTTTLAQITGLKTGLVKAEGESADSDLYPGIDLSTDGVLTLKMSVLNNATVELKNSNYSLSIADDVVTDGGESGMAWVFNNGTATYRQVDSNPYYSFDTKNPNKLVFNGSETVKGATPYVTVKGLNTALVINPSDDDELGYYSDNAFVKAVRIEATSESAGLVTIYDEAALNNGNITIDTKNSGAGYSIALEETLAAAWAPSGVGSWSFNKGTATYKGEITAHYTQDDEHTITYHKNQSYDIAKVTGLKSTLAGLSANGQVKVNSSSTWVDGLEIDDTAGTITVHQNMLGTGKASLTTGVQLAGQDYQFELGDDVKSYDKVAENDDARWKIDTKTGDITRIVWTQAHYALGSDSTSIVYNPEGENGELVKITGIAKGLNTIKGGEIRGITVEDEVGDDTNVGVAIPAGGKIIFNSYDVFAGAGTSVILTELAGASTYGNGVEYTLAMGESSGIPTIGDTVGFTTTLGQDHMTVTIYKEKTAGFSAAADGSAINYFTQTHKHSNDKIADVKGLSKDITVTSDDEIEGIAVEVDPNKNKTITLSNSVLIAGTDVTLTTTSDSSEYSLAAGADVVEGTNDNTPGWKATNTKGEFVLYSDFTIKGFKVENDGATLKSYPGNGSGTTAVATISGLATTAAADSVSHQIAGISIGSDSTILISKNALGTTDVTLKVESGKTYTLVLNNSDSAATGYVAPYEETSEWAYSNGTLTFKQQVTGGYSLASDSSIIYKPNNTITSTLNNLSQENISLVDTDSDGTYDEVGSDLVTFEDGVFTIAKADALAAKTVKLTTKSTARNYTVNYSLSLADDDSFGGVAEQALWEKKSTDTKAVLKQKTSSGYTLSDNKDQINYSSDPTTKTLATVSGLKKEVAAGTDSDDTDTYGKIAGITLGHVNSTSTVAFTAVTTTDDVGDVIRLSKSILTTSNVSVGNSDKYKLFLDTTTAGESVPVAPVASDILTVSGTTVTYKHVNTEYYDLKTDKFIKYEKATDLKEGNATTAEIFKITGLAKNLVVGDDGEIKGLAIDTDNSKVTLSAKVLGTSNVNITGGNYTLNLDTDVFDKEDAYGGASSAVRAEQTEWVGNGTTYTFKKYSRAYYELESGNKSIKVTAATSGKTYATIAGLSSGLVDDVHDSDNFDVVGFSAANSEDPTLGGVITLGEDQLDGKSKKITLTTSGNFKLELDSDVEADVTPKEWKLNSNKTSAVYTGTIGKGYVISEDAKTINYYADTDGTEATLATVTGIKSEADLNSATMDTESEEGYTIVTLNDSHVDNKNKVTIKGDFYKIDISSDATSKSATDPVAWVKTDNSTTATYQQQTYAGYAPSVDGKTLNYNKSTTTTKFATLSGLKKDVAAAGGSIAGVTLDTDNKIITVDSDILTNANVTLGKSDPYTLKLDTDVAGVSSVLEHFIFNNGTASIVKGTSEGWAEKGDGKTITYTKAVDNVVTTIAGLPKTLKLDTADTDYLTGKLGGFSGIGLSGTSSIVIDASVLKDTTTVTLTNKANANNGYTEYKLELGAGASSATTGDPKWTYSNGTAALKSITKEGYALGDYAANKTQKITHSAEKAGSADLAKITGLPKTMIIARSTDGTKLTFESGSSTLDAITYDTDKKVTLSDSFLSAVTVATALALTSSDYQFKEVSVTKPSTGAPELGFVASNGTATVATATSAGWSIESNKATYTTASNALKATIKGLNTSYNTSSDGDLKLDGTNITVGKTALTSSNVTLTKASGDNYALVLGSNVNSTMNTTTADNWKEQTEWVMSGTTANYKLYDKENWFLKNATTIQYNKPTNGSVFAAITGLAKKATIESSDVGVSSGVISLTADDLGTSKVALKITKIKDVTAKSTVKADVEVAAATNAKILAGNTKAATYKLALAGGLASSLATVSNEYWDTNGTTAKLTGDISQGYILATDNMSVTYQSKDQDGQVIAQITGLKKDAEVTKYSNPATVNGGLVTTVSLGAAELGTGNTVIKGTKLDGYKLAFDTTTGNTVLTNSTVDTAKWDNQDDWIASNGTFTYKNYDKAHYELDSKETTIAYKKDTDNQVHAVITGLNKNAKTEHVEKTVTGAASYVTINSAGVITLGDSALPATGGKIALTDKDNGGYTLALASTSSLSNIKADSVAAAFSGTGDNNKGTWTSYQTEGYFLGNDAQTFTYFTKTNETKKQTYATVTGLNIAATSLDGAASTFANKFDASSNTLALAAADLATSKKVTIGGTAAFNFSDAANFTITGSGSADRVTVGGANNTISAAAGNDRIYITGENNSVDAGAGNDYVNINSTGNSIQAGAGNDYFDFNSKSNNFFYASGNGNDVIANFNVDDTINITGVAKAKVSIEASGNDAIVKVNTATIKLLGKASNVSSLNVKANGEDVTPPAAANVLADDNYGTTPQLSALVKGTSAYMAEDLVATDATSLTKQSSAIAYSGSGKK